jgi:hypothetical protein
MDGWVEWSLTGWFRGAAAPSGGAVPTRRIGKPIRWAGSRTDDEGATRCWWRPRRLVRLAGLRCLKDRGSSRVLRRTEEPTLPAAEAGYPLHRQPKASRLHRLEKGSKSCADRVTAPPTSRNFKPRGPERPGARGPRPRSPLTSPGKRRIRSADRVRPPATGLNPVSPPNDPPALAGGGSRRPCTRAVSHLRLRGATSVASIG